MCPQEVKITFLLHWLVGKVLCGKTFSECYFGGILQQIACQKFLVVCVVEESFQETVLE